MTKKRFAQLFPARRRRGARGNCYAASEALYHLTGKAAVWQVCRVRHEGDTHWFLKSRRFGQIVDPTVSQFRTPPPYDKARATGFLTRHPSRRACELMARMVWQ